AAGIKPIIGCEVYVAAGSRHSKQPGTDAKRYHLVLLAKNKTGYQNLVKMVSRAWLEGFYYKPRIDKELLRAHGEGLIGTSACLAGEIAQALRVNDATKAKKIIKEYQQFFAPGDFYLELEHHPNTEQQMAVNEKMIKLAQEMKLPLVAAHDIHYVYPEDATAQDILMLVNTNAKFEDEDRLTMKQDDFSMQAPEQMADFFRHVPEAIKNTQKIAAACNLELKLGGYQLPHFAVPAGFNSNSYLKKLCEEGLPTRYQKTTTEMLDRLNYELGVIAKTGYASYFLIVQDFVRWAKQNNIVVGPGRGSAAGSFVSYLLGVTDIDPLKYNLLFERFLNPDRVSMPDIDLDFADIRRDEVIGYVRQKYGADKVAQIITFGTMAARAAIRDAGRAMGLPYNLCDQVAKAIPPMAKLTDALKTAELKQMYESDDQVKNLVDTALKLENVARHASTHACGVVITKEPLQQTIPLQLPTASKDAAQDTAITQYEMHAVEDLGLLKMDFLGLRTLTVMENALKIIEKLHRRKIDLSALPLDDQKTYELFQAAQTTGVFQLESGGMKRYLKELKPTEFEDIVAMVALYRPGPMEFIPDFIARKHGLKEIEYLHEKLEPILKNTYGVAVYQEQVMQIARDLAGFTLAEADILRKAVGKKIKKLLDEQKEKLLLGMEKNGLAKNIAQKIWSAIEPFAQYGFNRSHAACYALIGYRTAYLKAHFPTEFMAALINSESSDIERVAFLIDECKSMGISVLPPDVNESLADFTVVGPKKIRFGLTAVKNVGQNIVAALVAEREKGGPFKSITDLVSRVQDKDLNKKSLESLTKCGALDSLGDRNEFLFNMENILSFAREIQKAKKNGQTNLFEVLAQNGAPHQNEIRLLPAPAAGRQEKLAWEKELLGLYVSEHPYRLHAPRLFRQTIPCNQCSPALNGQPVKIGGVITKIQKIITKAGQPMLFVKIEDLTGWLEALVFPKTLEKTATLWQEGRVVVAGGRLSDKDDVPKLLCDAVRVIE
ncbi:MAG: DNA polymerase III subunit alpha, partial [Candidatus Portnoybacteria bacterium CG10_big_fil_rev_8_21_14_0_10_44_7]